MSKSMLINVILEEESRVAIVENGVLDFFEIETLTKETLKGNITCAKCELKKATKCATVVVVKKDDKETVYYFDKDGHKKYHDDICKGGKKGTVTGTVKKDGEKMIVTVKELKYDD